MFSYFRNVLLAIIFLFVSACSTPLPKGVTPNQATWLLGYHSIPAKYTRDNTLKSWRNDIGWMSKANAAVKSGVKVPVVLYMHGCAGIHKQGEAYRTFMLQQGYAVLMPDSFARGRLECGQEGTLSERVDMRTDEIANALKEIKKIPWIDQHRIILMGFSEGGNTVDNWSHPGFQAEIIISSACTLTGSGSPNAPKNVPVLAIVGSNDDFRPGQSCTITRKVGGSRSVVIPGAGHRIADYEETKTAIKAFLKQCCQN